MIACAGDHLEMATLLVEEKANTNQIGADGDSALCIACDKGHAGVVQMLLSARADKDQVNGEGESPLVVACMKNNLNIARLLLLHGVDPCEPRPHVAHRPLPVQLQFDQLFESFQGNPSKKRRQ